MTTQYGAPLTRAQMNLLRAAGLPDGTDYQIGHSDGSWTWNLISKGVEHILDKYRLPADHAAYTLANAGWLDGRNVALWFGGEKAPDDAVQYLTASGVSYEAYGARWEWKHGGKFDDIIAYTRKAEGMTTHADRVLADAVTIAKMTEVEWELRVNAYGMLFEDVKDIISDLGLIKPEPTREDRFWQAQPNGGAHVTDDVKAWVREALNFEMEK